MRKIIVIAHNVRSAHNVGSLLRTAEGLGVQKVILSGYTPYPSTDNDSRLPHLANKISKNIDKTALGAANLQEWSHVEDITNLIHELKDQSYTVIALEQASHSVPLPSYAQSLDPGQNIALIIGREVEGIESEIIALADKIVEIPMLGRKESFNVVQAAAMALYAFTFY